jgi:hypothetical protein
VMGSYGHSRLHELLGGGTIGSASFAVPIAYRALKYGCGCCDPPRRIDGRQGNARAAP